MNQIAAAPQRTHRPSLGERIFAQSRQHTTNGNGIRAHYLDDHNLTLHYDGVRVAHVQKQGGHFYVTGYVAGEWERAFTPSVEELVDQYRGTEHPGEQAFLAAAVHGHVEITDDALVARSGYVRRAVTGALAPTGTGLALEVRGRRAGWGLDGIVVTAHVDGKRLPDPFGHAAVRDAYEEARVLDHVKI